MNHHHSRTGSFRNSLSAITGGKELDEDEWERMIGKGNAVLEDEVSRNRDDSCPIHWNETWQIFSR